MTNQELTEIILAHFGVEEGTRMDGLTLSLSPFSTALFDGLAA